MLPTLPVFLKRCLISLLGMISSAYSYGQINCATPIQVNLCSSTVLYNQSTAGAGNHATNWSCYNGPGLNGADVFYRIQLPPASNPYDVLFVTLGNVSDADDSQLHVIWLEANCGSVVCSAEELYNISAGKFVSTNDDCIAFPINNQSGTYYLAIDHRKPGNATFDLGLGYLEEATITTIQDTRGNWGLDQQGCASPLPDNDMNGFEVTWQGTQSPLPVMVMAGDSGQMCVTIYTANLTGQEQLKTVSMSLGSCWKKVKPTLPTNNGGGNYDLLGQWKVKQTGNNITFDFKGSSDPKWGDGHATPHQCQAYTFCFKGEIHLGCMNANNLTINVVVSTDGYGTGGTIMSANGCCQSNCCAGYLQQIDPITTSVGFGIGVGMGAGAVLPIKLTYFEAESVDDGVDLYWGVTNQYAQLAFEVEYSVDGLAYTPLDQLAAAEGSDNAMHFKLHHSTPAHGDNYYRLKWMDEALQEERSEIITVKHAVREGLLVSYTLPDQPPTLRFSTLDEERYVLQVYNLNGQLQQVLWDAEAVEAQLYQFSLKALQLKGGVYVAVLRSESGMEQVKFVVP